MQSGLKRSLIAGLLALAGAAGAQPAMPGQCDHAGGPHGAMAEHGMSHQGMGLHDAARLQAMLDRRNAVLQAQLKLTAAQEPAWKTLTEALKPPLQRPQFERPDPVEMARLSTPERLDRMKALRAQHHTQMTTVIDQRDAAIKTFYAVLTPEQQKVFDALALKVGAHHAHPAQNRG